MTTSNSDAQKEQNPKQAGSEGTYTYNYSGNNRTYHDGRNRTAHRAIVRLIKALDVVLVSIPFFAAWFLYYSHMLYAKDFYRKGNYFVALLFVVVYYLFAHLYSGFTIHISRISEIIYAQTLGALLADCIMFVVMWMLIRHVPNIPIMILVFAAQMIMIALWSALAHKWYFSNYPASPTAVIYDEMEGRTSMEAMRRVMVFSGSMICPVRE